MSTMRGSARGWSTKTQQLPRVILDAFNGQSRANGGWWCQCRHQSTAPSTATIRGKPYPTDSWTNVPAGILDYLPRKLHLQPNHPISITRKIIESRFPSSQFTHYNDLNPIVTTHQNFDSLGFPADHPGRSKTDTYYLNSTTCLRTHTSAHQAETFTHNPTAGYTITADVYRRDAIDKSHYPVFHQMEGALMWDRSKVSNGNITSAVQSSLSQIPHHDLQVEDPNPTTHPLRNPLQPSHTAEEVEAISTHLKHSIEDIVVAIFAAARTAALSSPDPAVRDSANAPLKVRWIEASFPFTSPSWELEVFWQGSWLELLGCGVVKQDLLNNAGVPQQTGWAFGIGLERVAMILFSIPDIRLFWSRDERFLGQFNENREVRRFVPFSKYPLAARDIAFWVKDSVPVIDAGMAGSAAGGSAAGSSAPSAPASSVHENDVMQIIRDVGGDLVEDVSLVDEFRDEKGGRKSFCYRINYRSLERTIPRSETNELHAKVGEELVRKLGVELR